MASPVRVELVGGPEHGRVVMSMPGLPLRVAGMLDVRHSYGGYDRLPSSRMGTYRDAGPDDPEDPNSVRIYEWQGWDDGPPTNPCLECERETRYDSQSRMQECGFCDLRWGEHTYRQVRALREHRKRKRLLCPLCGKHLTPFPDRDAYVCEGVGHEWSGLELARRGYT